MKLKKIDGVKVSYREKLPDGVTVLYVNCYEYSMYKTLPEVVESEEGKTFGLTGWNSDRGVAYYRSDIRYLKEVK